MKGYSYYLPPFLPFFNSLNYCPTHIKEFCEGRSDRMSEQRHAHGSTKGLRGKEGRKHPYFLLQKYQFFRDARKTLAFLAVVCQELCKISVPGCLVDETDIVSLLKCKLRMTA